MNIVWQKQASKDLVAIFKHIESESPQNALMVFGSIIEQVGKLKLFPYKFPKEHSIITGDVRFAVIWSFKIVYAIEVNTILVLRIFNTKQNPKKLKK